MASIAADAIVLGVGLTPNDALARDAGIACDRGVLVDERCRTSAPDVYAAGDVAVSARPGGGRLRLESWQNAQDQGTAAALSALGLGEAYRPTARSVGAIRRHGADRRLPALAASEVLRRRRMPARCCRWRWMRKAAPWRA